MDQSARCSRCVTLSLAVMRNTIAGTVRQTAKKFGISKSTVHKDMVDRLQHINPSLASQVRVVLDINKSERHIRGGMATKEKYQHRLAICSKDDEE